jgi:hypothetical protein
MRDSDLRKKKESSQRGSKLRKRLNLKKNNAWSKRDKKLSVST